MVVKVAIADMYGYISCNGDEVEKAKSCFMFSARMAIDCLLQKNIKISGTSDNMVCLSKAMNEISDYDKFVYKTDMGNPSICDSIGYYHNWVLSHSSLEYSNSNITNKMIYYDLGKFIPMQLDPDTKFNFNMLDEVRDSVFVKCMDSNVPDFLLELKKHSSVDKVKMDAFKAVAQNLSNALLLGADRRSKTIFNNVINIIDNSSIPVEDKKELKEAVTVGYASMNLWNGSMLID